MSTSHPRLEIPGTPPCYQQAVYGVPILPWFYWHPTWSLYPILISSHTDILCGPHVKQMHTLATYHGMTSYFKYSFFPQTIVAWNALPKSVVTSPTLVLFKVALGRGRYLANAKLVFWTHQPVLFLVLQPILTQLLSFGFTFRLYCFYLLHCIFSFLLIYHVQTPAINLTPWGMQ